MQFVHQFIDLTLAAACDDEDMRNALRENHILLKFQEIEAVSHGDLRRLLDCHGRDSMWFSLGLVNLVRLGRQNNQTTAEVEGESVISENLLKLAKDPVITGLSEVAYPQGPRGAHRPQQVSRVRPKGE